MVVSAVRICRRNGRGGPRRERRGQVVGRPERVDQGLGKATARLSFAPVHDLGSGAGEAAGDINVLRHQGNVLGRVTSAPTVWGAGRANSRGADPDRGGSLPRSRKWPRCRGSCTICSRRGGHRRRNGRMRWTCCPGSGSLDGRRGVRSGRLVAGPAISAGGLRWLTSPAKRGSVTGHRSALTVIVRAAFLLKCRTQQSARSSPMTCCSRSWTSVSTKVCHWS